MIKHAFERRILFTGTLKLKSALHIGNGWTVGSPADNPVIRTSDGRPFIPGSSMKGAFRSTVEKLASTIGIRSCGLNSEDECVGAQGKAYREFNTARKDNNWSDSQLLEKLETNLCETCQLFGSPYASSKVFFSDLYPPQDDQDSDKMIQIRDGVAIDRDSEKSVDSLLFNYEVVAPTQTFKFELLLENPDSIDLGLVCIGLNEFISGFGYIGGRRSRGLGNCTLEDLKIYDLDLNCGLEDRSMRLKKYLIGKTPKEKMVSDPNPGDFIQRGIAALLAEVSNVEEIG